MKILIIKTMMAGDALFVTPAVSAIKRHYPDAELHILTGSGSADIFRDNPCIGKIIPLNEDIFIRHRIRQLIRFAAELKVQRYDMVISFHRHWAMHAFAFLVGAPARIGLSYRGSGFFLTKKIYSNPHIDRYPPRMYLDIANALGAATAKEDMEVYLTDNDRNQADALLRRNGIAEAEPFVCICPGAASNPRNDKRYVAAKRWKQDNFAKVGDYIIEHLRLKVVLLGAEKEKELCSYIADSMPIKPVNLAGLTTIKTLTAIIKRSVFIITNDSLPLHLAVAVGVPSISLFGPTNGKFKTIVNRFHTVVQSSLDCSPCWHNENALPRCRSPRCMDYIKVEDVISSIKKLSPDKIK